MMQLISRVNESSMIEIRKYLMMPVTKVLIFVAAFVCGVTGIVGFIENRDFSKFIVVLLFSACLVGLVCVLEHVLPLAKYKRLQMLYDSDVLNMRVCFDDNYIRVVSLAGNEISRLHYCEVFRYYETENYAVIFADWHIFIFDKAQAVDAGLRQYLEAHDATLVLD